ncbi:hypothetical protein, partial [Photobacterium damselae]|uniref:hypothetical protein n=1 Tax=Photobacterium damselae TaxID=38293 RepID=UPI001EFCB98C
MKNLIYRIGIDKTIFYMLMTRGFGAISSFVTILMLGVFLTKSEIGYYYTFASIIGLQVFFELGFSVVLRQYMSHLNANVIFYNNLPFTTELNRGDIISLYVFSKKWYFKLAIVLAFFLLLSGWLFFNNELSDVNWKFPWLCLTILTAISLTYTPILSTIESLGFVLEVSKLRYIQILISSVISWIVIYFGGGLYCTLVMPIVTIVVNFFWINKHFKKLLLFFNTKHTTNRKWFSEMFEMQGKVAISWVFGYLIFQIINPISFKLYGSEISGQIGLTLSIFSLMLNMSLSWINTKMPYWGRLIAKKEAGIFYKLFLETLKQSSVFLIFIEMFFILFVFFIVKKIDLSFYEKLLPIDLMLLLAITMISRHVVGSIGYYIRVHKKEKLVFNAIITSVVMIGLFYLI